METADFDDRTQVLVAGGGACGAVAALAARAAGADVALVEQDAAARGTTSMSQGLICAAGTAAQREAGVEDGPELLLADILAKTRGLTDPALARAVAFESGPALDWLVSAHGLPHTLDQRFRASFGHGAARVHGWPGRGGGDLLDFLHQRLAAVGVDVLTQARLVEIAERPGGAAGVLLERPRGEREAIGCDALVLATGGFAANAAMVARHMPEVAGAVYHGHEGSDGLGMRLGAGLGGALADMGAYQGYAMLTDPQGVTTPPGFLTEGGVLVNADGRRFANETADLSGLVLDVLAQPGGLAWLIHDDAIEARCAYVPETQALAALNAARTAPDLAGLAARLAVPEAALTAAVAEARMAAEAGRPDAFGRAWNPERPPRGPFRALRVRGALYHTQGGLQVDGSARVLRPDGSGLANVFAGGGAARGVSGPSCWGYLPAMGLCAAVALGSLAGRAAAETALRAARRP